MARRVVKADSARWSKKSQRSVSSAFTKEYTDIDYFCWRCGKRDVFNAEDQRDSYEVKKHHVWQRRILCRGCWAEANEIRKHLATCRKEWSASKATLKTDTAFLSCWLSLLARLEEYVPYKPDTATKGMLVKLMRQNA